MRRGFFIVLVGIDGAGGETLSANIASKCSQNDIPCLQLKYPDYTSPWGQIIRTYLRGTLNITPDLLFLTYVTDQLKDQNLIKTFKQQGGIVVCDRYVTSAIAYESALNFPYTKAVQLAEVLQFEKPDFVVCLDIPPEISAQRKRQEKGKLDVHEANSELLAKVRRVYRTMAKTHLFGEWIMIDATNTPEEICEQVWEKVFEKISSNKGNVEL